MADQDVSYEVRTLRPTEDATDELLRIADEESADLLVIGLRRRSPVGKLILGANAQRILLDAACPVLAVKPAE
ncbi:universal stress protein [Flexivirga alba]|uniref:Universal stress protein n=1 Tax=Flexivirga alba TaxID=702742 RepID=A0ABW2AH39_9MICO